MTKNTPNNLSQVLIDPSSREAFSMKMATIVLGVHALALGGLFYFSLGNVLAWVAAHLFFGVVGIALGFHRLYSHRSYTPVGWLGKVIGVVATLCFQGSPTFWAAGHRVHHALNGGYGDPYSARRGFLWSHFLWMFYTNPNGFSYLRARRLVSDLKRDKFLSWLETNATLLNLLVLGGLFLFAVAIGNIGLFFWLGPVRIVSIWHCVWFTNSYSHHASLTNAPGPDRIRNSLIMSLLIGGEGDHRYHHEHPDSVRHSASSINLDTAYWLLKVLKVFGLVTFKPPRDSSKPAGSEAAI